MPFALLVLAGLVTASGAFSQPLGGPVEGFVFDPPTASIRPILGRPGSAYLGPAELAGVAFASVAPGQRHGLAVRNGKLILLTGLGGPDRRALELRALEAVPDAAAWSADGGAAVLYCREEGWLQVVRGLPTAPILEDRLEPQNAGRIRKAATDGQSIFVLAEDGAGLIRRAFDGTRLPMPGVEDAVAMAVARGGLVYVADRSGAVFALDEAFQRIDGLANSAAAVKDLVLVDGPGGRPLIAALTGDRLVMWDTRTWETVISSRLDFPAQDLLLVRAGSLAVGHRSGPQDPLWIGTSEGIRFVPAAAIEPAGEAVNP